jgi:NADH dehydrogenase FAD-containing subunit
MSEPAPHVLLVGGGHASIYALKRAGEWTRRGVRVTLLSDHPHLYYSGMVPEYLGDLYETDEVRLDLVRWCAETGATWHEGRATRLDSDARTVTTESGEDLRADLVAFDIGARNPEPPGGGEADRTKPLHYVERFAEWLREVESADPAAPGFAPRDLVIVGGGAAGTEIALNVSARMLAASGLSRIGQRLRITLVEPSDSLLPAFPARAQRVAESLLANRGVDLRFVARAASVEGEGVRLDSGDYLPADRVLWAAGVKASGLFREAGLPTGEGDFVHVTERLHVPARPWLFAAGDCALVEGHEDLARIGVHAVKQGPVLFQNLSVALEQLAAGIAPARLDASAYDRFRPYAVAPLVLSTGQPEAIYVAGKAVLHKRLALRAKHWADLRWMVKYRFGDGADLSLGEKAHARAALS